MLLVLAASVACSESSGPAAVPSASAESVRAPRRSELVALARLEPRGGVTHVSAPIVDTVGEILVKEGAAVEAGAGLANLSSRPLRVAEHEEAKHRLAEAEAQAAGESARGEAAVMVAQAALDRAKVRMLEVPVEEARVGASEATFELARQEVGRQTELGGRVSVRDRQTGAAELEVKKQAVLEAKARLALLRRDVYTGILAAEAGLQAEKASSKKAMASIPVESLRAQLKAAEARADQTVVRAPIAGTILKIMLRPGERTDRSPLVDMGDTTEMHAVAEVDQTDIHLVKPGQRVVLASASLRGDVAGTVDHVGAMITRNDIFGDDPNPQTNARVFEVRIKLEKSDIAVRYTNLEVRARIMLND